MPVVRDDRRRLVARHEPRGELGGREVVVREVVGVRDLVGLAGHERGPLAVEVDELLRDRLTLARVGRQEGCRGQPGEDVPELPAEVEPVLHRHVHALPRLRAVRVAGVAGEEHPGRATVAVLDVVEPVGDAVPDLVHAVPGDLLHVDRVRVQDLVRAADDLLDGGAAHRPVVGVGHLAEVDVHAREVPALARDVQDVARLGGDRALDAPVGEVRVHEHVHDAPRVRREPPDVPPSDRLAHAAARPVASDDELRADRALLTGQRTFDVAHPHRERVLVRVVPG